MGIREAFGGSTHARGLGEGRRRRLVLAFAAAALSVATIVPAAFAQVGLRERYDIDWSFSHDDCGWTVDVTGGSTGTFHARIGKGDFASAFFFHDNYEWQETHVRSTDGATITLGGNGVFQEGRATLVEGTTYAFSSVNAGQLLVVRDSSGEILLRDRGSMKQTLMLDTLGDDELGGIFVGEISFRLNGQFPSETIDYCTWFDM